MIHLLEESDLIPLGTFRQGRPEYALAREVRYSAGQNDADEAMGGAFQEIVVPKGFVTDGYSLPGRLISAIWQPKHARWKTPAVIHDWLFETKLLPFEQCNEIFWRAMTEAGVKKLSRLVAFAAVQLFGDSGYGLISPQNRGLVMPLRTDLGGVAAKAVRPPVTPLVAAIRA